MDPSYKFSGIGSFVAYLFRRRRRGGGQAARGAGEAESEQVDP